MKTLLIISMLFIATYANEGYNAGYTEGYKTIYGSNSLTPLAPLAPLAPITSTDFREGIKQGIQDAKDIESPYYR